LRPDAINGLGPTAALYARPPGRGIESVTVRGGYLSFGSGTFSAGGIVAGDVTTTPAQPASGGQQPDAQAAFLHFGSWSWHSTWHLV
jgi:hypothetical protein